MQLLLKWRCGAFDLLRGRSQRNGLTQTCQLSEQGLCDQASLNCQTGAKRPTSRFPFCVCHLSLCVGDTDPSDMLVMSVQDPSQVKVTAPFLTCPSQMPTGPLSERFYTYQRFLWQSSTVCKFLHLILLILIYFRYSGWCE